MSHPPLEARIEQHAIDDIKRRWPAAVTRKLNGAGHRDWPDRLVILPGGVVLFLEFKRPGEVPRPTQAYWLDLLQRLGVKVFVAESRDAALGVCEAAWAEKRSHAGRV